MDVQSLMVVWTLLVLVSGKLVLQKNNSKTEVSGTVKCGPIEQPRLAVKAVMLSFLNKKALGIAKYEKVGYLWKQNIDLDYIFK